MNEQSYRHRDIDFPWFHVGRKLIVTNLHNTVAGGLTTEISINLGIIFLPPVWSRHYFLQHDCHCSKT